MSDISQGLQPPLSAPPSVDRQAMPFGSLAFLGAAASLVFCYGQVLISLLAPLFGMAAFELNIHLQAVFMWGFALVTVMGLFNDQKLHKSKVPLVVSAVAVVTIIFTLYVYYDIRILILGYVLLVIAALLNQNMRLVSLNREVKAQADRLSDLNQTLEKRVEDQVEEIERIAQLKRFLSSEVADLITAEGKESLLDSHRRQIACLFCDLRNFTAFSESVEPEDVMDVLQAVHTTMGDLAARHGGSIGHLSGDGLMVIFNDPLPCDEPVARAIRLALDMRRAFTDIQARWRDLGHELGLGIGIAYGYATLGLIGSEGRHDYTAIGNVVNIAARLCDQADDGDILIDKRAHVEVETATQTEAAGLLSLKGVGKKVEAYKVMGAAETA